MAPICRCKFVLSAVRTEIQNRYDRDREEYVPTKMYDLEFRPVHESGDPDTDDHENAKFWEATPSGQFHFKTVNAEIAGGFTIGEAYYVDFTRTS